MNQFILDFLALFSIFSGILVITASNPVVSLLFLITLFINVAGYLILLGIGFIGITYLIVYVGAIAILFLFVIMMLNLQLAELTAIGPEYNKNLPLGAILGSLFIFEVFSLLPDTNTSKDALNLQSFFYSTKEAITQEGLNLFNFVQTASLQASLHYTNKNIFTPTENPIDNSLDQVSFIFNSSAADQQISTFLQVQSIGNILYLSGAVWLIVVSLILLLAMVGPIVLSLNKSNTLVE